MRRWPSQFDRATLTPGSQRSFAAFLRRRCRERRARVSPLEAAPTHADDGAPHGPRRRSGPLPADRPSAIHARMRFRRAALKTLDEAAAYARCHGQRDNDVRIVHLPPRRKRYTDVLTTGEELRELFEQRLDARDPDHP